MSSWDLDAKDWLVRHRKGLDWGALPTSAHRCPVLEVGVADLQSVLQWVQLDFATREPGKQSANIGSACTFPKRRICKWPALLNLCLQLHVFLPIRQGNPFSLPFLIQ